MEGKALSQGVQADVQDRDSDGQGGQESWQPLHARRTKIGNLSSESKVSLE